METKKAPRTVVAVLTALMKSKATYRFIGVLLVALGVANGETVMSGVETIVCAFIGCV